MDIETIAIASGIVFGAGLIVAKLLIGRYLANRPVVVSDSSRSGV